jgi:hypothetical protein
MEETGDDNVEEEDIHEWHSEKVHFHDTYVTL